MSAAPAPSRLPPHTTHLLQAMTIPTRGQHIALVDPQRQKTYTYRELSTASLRLAQTLQSGGGAIKCIASYNKPGANYVITALAAWHLGATLVPLCVAHTAPEISYFVMDSGSDVLVHEPGGEEGVQHLDVPKVCINEAVIWAPEAASSQSSPEFNIPDPLTDALILYTSGTSGAPKGCVHTHDGLTHMIASLVDAWEYSADDKILHFLPLHHLHGVLNKLWCTLYAGGEVEFMKSADARGIWRRLAASDTESRPPTIFMAVPTIYARMLEAAAAATDAPTTSPTDHNSSSSSSSESQGKDKSKGLTLTLGEVRCAVAAAGRMRVMVSGSAALPDPVMAAWKTLTGHDLLEVRGVEGGRVEWRGVELQQCMYVQEEQEC
jgi:malonyl-CoA/methylmalonyl-CoA synthetase